MWQKQKEKKRVKQKLGVKRSKKILDFLARRTGYTSAMLQANHDNTFMFLTFLSSKKENWFNHVMVAEGSVAQTLSFKSDDNAESVLKRLLENPESIFVAEGPEFAEDESRGLIQISGLLRSRSCPWVHLFFEGECLEKLVIESELLDG